MRAFRALYFTQGISEPTEGLVVQPTRWLLKSWGETNEQITSFAAWITLPWVLKPLYGLIADFLPLGRNRRKNYLVLTTAVACLGYLGLYFYPPDAKAERWLFWALFLPTVAVAFTDVVVDALMIAVGQPRGITGHLQSIQWSAIWAATILNGELGGLFSAGPAVPGAFLLCSGAAGVALLIASSLRDDPPPPDGEDHTVTWRETLDELAGSIRHPVLWLLLGFSGVVELHAAVDDDRLLALDANVGFRRGILRPYGRLAGGRRDDCQPRLWTVLPAGRAFGADAPIDRAGDRGHLGVLDGLRPGHRQRCLGTGRVRPHDGDPDPVGSGGPNLSGAQCRHGVRRVDGRAKRQRDGRHVVGRRVVRRVADAVGADDRLSNLGGNQRHADRRLLVSRAPAPTRALAATAGAAAATARAKAEAAIVACMRKLLILLNTILKTQTPCRVFKTA